jgi:hypothetical protein
MDLSDLILKTPDGEVFITEPSPIMDNVLWLHKKYDWDGWGFDYQWKHIWKLRLWMFTKSHLKDYKGQID